MTFDDFDALDDGTAPALPIRVSGAKSRAITMTPQQFFALPAPALPCGYFALTLTDGSVRHFRIRLDKRGIFAGKRTLARLTGPTLESDEWETVALVGEVGFAVFKKFRKDRVGWWASVLWSLLHGRDESGYTVESDVRCRWSMRKLTNAAAHERQLNLTAAKMFGVVEVKTRKKREGGK